jgi:hypothetical protein
LKRAGFDDVPRVSDPDRTLYHAFGLERGNFGQLFGLRAWLRVVSAAARGHGIGPLAGDGLQMPGVFLVERGLVRRAFRHVYAGERPDYVEMVRRLALTRPA